MPHRNVLRDRAGEDGSRVGMVELFFDLVFVLAITQLSHTLLHHLTPDGAAETLLLFVAVWNVWIYTAWCTNWVSPDRAAVRVMLFAVMILGLLMSASIPNAFEGRGWSFGAAVAAIQVGRSLFMLWALEGHSDANYRNFARITAWLVVASAFWIWGGFAEASQRPFAWTVALSVELIGPVFGYFVPGLGRSATTDWDVSGDHMAERCGLFVIIALGEVIMMLGATFSGLEWAWDNAVVFIGATIGSIAMWWIYFNIGAERATHLIATSRDPGAIARIAYTFFHIPIVAGIIVSAVATELVIAHPHAKGEAAVAITAIGGSATYLVGNILFKRATGGTVLPFSHLAGLVAFAVVGWVWQSLDASQIGTASAAIMVMVAVWETLSLRSYREQRQHHHHKA